MYNWETVATTVSLSDILGVVFSQDLKGSMEAGGLLAVRGRAFPCILQRNMDMCLLNPAPETRAKFQVCTPPWGFSHTPVQGKLLPGCHIPAVWMQRYKPESAGTNPRKWDHCTWKCVLPCIKPSVHMQNRKGCTYKPQYLMQNL